MIVDRLYDREENYRIKITSERLKISKVIIHKSAVSRTSSYKHIVEAEKFDTLGKNPPTKKIKCTLRISKSLEVR